MMWLTCGRHGDLTNPTMIIRRNGTGFVLEWERMKSDRYGDRLITKYVTVTTAMAYLFDSTMWCTYRQLLAATKRVDPTMSTYSIRRGAMACLADMGAPMPIFGLMSAHTPSTDPCSNVRRYVDQNAVQPEGKMQLRLSRLLGRSVWEARVLTARSFRL